MKILSENRTANVIMWRHNNERPRCVYAYILDKTFKYFSVFPNEGVMLHPYNKPYPGYSRGKRRAVFSFPEPTHSSIQTTHIRSSACVQTGLLPHQKRAAPKKSALEM